MKTSKLGQNFLVNRNVAEKIVKHFLPVQGDILEIGPGKGVLTELLFRHRRDNKIIAVELDDTLFYRLKNKHGGREAFELLNRNILKLDLSHMYGTDAGTGAPNQGNLNILGNIPYYISRELMDWVIRYHGVIARGVFMVQKEFADKLTAPVGNKLYNARGVMFNRLFRVQKCFDVQPGSFSPRPAVKSTVFSFGRAAPAAAGEDIPAQDFYLFLQACFKNRRKTLFNNLSNAANTERLWEIFEHLRLDPRIRAEQLTADDFTAVYCFFAS